MKLNWNFLRAYIWQDVFVQLGEQDGVVTNKNTYVYAVLRKRIRPIWTLRGTHLNSAPFSLISLKNKENNWLVG